MYGQPAEGYPPQNHPAHGQPPQGYPPQGYPAHGQPQGHPPYGHSPQDLLAHGQSPDSYPAQGYPPPDQPPQGYPPYGQLPQAYPAQGYPSQPAVPPQYQPPGGPGYPPQQLPPPTQGTSRAAKTLIAVVGLGIVGVVVAGVIASTTAPAGAEVGECIKVVSSTATSTKVDKVDCSSREATFKVGANLDSSTDSCPSGDYAKYSDRGGRRSDGFALCLMLNAAEGECFKQEGTRSADAVKVTCDSSATHKVVKVSEGRSDENECSSGEIVFVYSQPATTICLTEE